MQGPQARVSREITATRVHYGYRRVHVLLRQDGWKDNHKPVYRLYLADGLTALFGYMNRIIRQDSFLETKA